MDTLEVVQMIDTRRELDRRWSGEVRRLRNRRAVRLGTLAAAVIACGLYGGFLDWFASRFFENRANRMPPVDNYIKASNDS
jgi:hypothetical protein